MQKTAEEKKLYEWVKAEQGNLPNETMWMICRLASKPERIENVLYNPKLDTIQRIYNAFGASKSIIIEWLKEYKSIEKGNWRDVLNIMFIAHEEFLPNSPADHEQSELYMIMAKRIAFLQSIKGEDKPVKQKYFKIDKDLDL